MRVYEFAKSVGVSSKDVLFALSKSGHNLKSHMSVLSSDQEAFLSKEFSKKGSDKSNVKISQALPKEDKTKEKKHVNITSGGNKCPSLGKKSVGESIIQKQSGKSNKSFGKKPSVPAKKSISSAQERTPYSRVPANKGPVSVKSSEPVQIDLGGSTYTVSDLALILGVSAPSLTAFFLGKGKFYAINAVVSKDDIIHFAPDLNLIINDQSASQDSVVPGVKKVPNSGESRSPVVTIMGHVDHGKTTLIDFIRKTKVASREVGGITQCVSAYSIQTSNGQITLIDTPGHEAFFSMRDKGAKVTDIAVIIIAADDGVMPQTVESIKLAKQIGASLIIAFNKMDKDGVEFNLDKIKEKLSQYDVLTEDWGGDVVCVPISAKTGLGVDSLLEMIQLQAEVMELKSRVDVDAKAFVLESQIEKGVGATASVIVQEGVLKQKDSFFIGDQKGRVKALFNHLGENVKSAGPSRAVKVVGLSSVACPGDILSVGQKDESTNSVSKNDFSLNKSKTGQKADMQINLIIKAGGFGELEALQKSLSLLCDKDKSAAEMINVVSGSVGDIFESDVLLARDTNSKILGMNVKVDKAVVDIATEHKVQIVKDKIIYRLTEHVEDQIKAKLKNVKELKLVGSGRVKKVFNFGSKGIVSGCQVEEGQFVENAIVHCIRENKKVGEGKINSLQRNKHVVKDVQEGSDCGLICNDFKDWIEGDTVKCFVEVAAS